MNAPQLAVGDGAMGFWAALDEVYGETRQQRCWMHKTCNVLNYASRTSQPKMKQALHDIWQAATRQEAEAAFDQFGRVYEPKYPKAVQCLQKDREALLAFYDFPAPHWQSLRTTNPIESSFGTIRHRTRRAKGCLSRDSMLHMIFKLGECAQQNWRRRRPGNSVSYWIPACNRNAINDCKPTTFPANPRPPLSGSDFELEENRYYEF